jgi:hypothetical protein
MKSKLFFAAFINLVWVSFPQNIIGCGPGIDPYDYYTSFLSNKLTAAKAFQPFYYTGASFLYSEQEPVSTTELLASEWAGYCGVPVTDKQAAAFVNTYKLPELKKLYSHIEKKQALVVPADMKANAMTSYFIRNKDLEGLGYIMYAKQAEPFVTGSYQDWEAITRDSLKMDKLMKNGRQLYAAAKTDFFRLRYAYQIIRLAHYSGNYPAAIKAYDEMVAANSTSSLLQPLSLALKAGALFHTDRRMEAAYLFSKAFSASPVKRISNYISFDWAVESARKREEYLALCANNKEKADMLALFALNTASWELEAMEKIYQLDPANQALEILAVREIKKAEEFYLTPMLDKQEGGKTFFYNWNQMGGDSAMTANSLQVKNLHLFLQKLAEEKKVVNPALYQVAAGYTALIQKDFTGSRRLLDKAKGMPMTGRLSDQWQLTNLLLEVNATEKIDAAFEEKIAPSVRWLAQKALAEKEEGNSWNSPPAEWKTFYRNLFSEVIAKRYRQQGDRYKEALAVGSAEFIMNGGKPVQYGSMAADFLHNQSSSKDVATLYAYLTSKTKSSFADFLIKNNSLKLAEVIDFAGTAYLRDNNYSKAIEWFGKNATASSGTIDKNPFIELMYDQSEKLSTDKVKTTKMAFAKEMQRLEGLLKSDKANAATNYYKLALGLYNTTYYGYAWELVEYWRSGADGYYIPKGATEFQKNYYGCYKAQDYFKLAMEASGNPEFKTKCMFMMAKCSQKQLRRPQYEDYNYNWEQYDAAEKTYLSNFMNNTYFPNFKKEYGSTKFYQQAFNTCSYLRDYQF